MQVVCSPNADLFNPDLPDNLRRDLIELIAATPFVDWHLLTSRIDRFDAVFGERRPENLFLGVRISNQSEAIQALPALLATPVRARYVCVELQSGPIDLTAIPIRACAQIDAAMPEGYINAIGQYAWEMTPISDIRTVPMPAGLDWVICDTDDNGNSDRPSCDRWARDLRDQCLVEGVPFLDRQLGHIRAASSIKRHTSHGAGICQSGRQALIAGATAAVA